jgi:hypothetical protein
VSTTSPLFSRTDILQSHVDTRSVDLHEDDCIAFQNTANLVRGIANVARMTIVVHDWPRTVPGLEVPVTLVTHYDVAEQKPVVRKSCLMGSGARLK